MASRHDNPEKTARYLCTRCGNCCRWEGYVHLHQHEVDEIAGFLGLSTEDFISRHTRLAPARKNLALRENPDESCIFLTSDNLCRIEPVKPQQCREFPNEWDVPQLREQCNAMDTGEDS